MIAPGKYSAQARAAELGETSTGKEQVAVEFEIVNADHAGERLTWYGFFTEKTTQRTIESLRIAGWRGEDLTDLSSIGGDAAPVVEIVVEHDEYQGKTSAKVAWVNRAGGLAMKNGLAPDKKAAFAARMRGMVAAVDQRLRVSAPPPAPKPAGDVPF